MSPSLVLPPPPYVAFDVLPRRRRWLLHHPSPSVVFHVAAPASAAVHVTLPPSLAFHVAIVMSPSLALPPSIAVALPPSVAFHVIPSSPPVLPLSMTFHVAAPCVHAVR